MSDSQTTLPELIQQAKEILSGQAAQPKDVFALAKKLNGCDQIGYARKLAARARKMQDADWSLDQRRELAQLHALTTYKDPDLPTDQKFVRALAILQEGDDLKTTTDQESLGQAGAIYKRIWEATGERRNLSRSLGFYLQGYEHGLKKVIDPANELKRKDRPTWAAINAAFVLDVLANMEEEDASESGIESVSGASRRERAARLRQETIKKLTDVALTGAEFKDDWWIAIGLAQAHFGLGKYDKASEWLQRSLEREQARGDKSEWPYQATIQQLASIARLHEKNTGPNSKINAVEARKTLEKFLEARGFKNQSVAVESAWVGKVGLALSGGGFRASLFHIGVLAKLADIGVLNRVEVLSCVSGGSIIGAHYYLELRKLFREKDADAQFERCDYIQLVKNLERDFLAGVQTNVRTRVIAGWWSNMKMIFLPGYSRTMRVGELYEQKIFSRVEDDEGDKPRWLNDLHIQPKDESEDFAPKRDNWQRTNKVPIMFLNATSLNTGHVWQFTASYMGEPPSAINSEIDANYRLRRMYYNVAPKQHQRIRLGYAVASSSCVPGMFEPISLEGLYKDKTVRLVDGGVFDNQGTASLLEQDCSVLLVSDASGQMLTDDQPGSTVLDVITRSSSISMERIRWAQHRELESRQRSGLLRGLMFIHMKKDLETDPVDWIDCPDPYDSTDDARPPELRGPLTRYGVRKDIQRLLSAVRTDLDSFSDGEAYALMASGYFMTEYQFAKSMGRVFQDIHGEDIKRRSAWRFLTLEQSVKQPGRDEKLKKLLGVSDQLSFKIWQLSRTLRTIRSLTGTLILAAIAAAFLWFVNDPTNPIIPRIWQQSLFSFGLGETGKYTLRLGWVISFVLAMVVGNIVGGKVMKTVNWRWTVIKASIGLVMSTVGWLLARLHLWTFDKWFLRCGKRNHILDQEKPES